MRKDTLVKVTVLIFIIEIIALILNAIIMFVGIIKLGTTISNSSITVIYFMLFILMIGQLIPLPSIIEMLSQKSEKT